MIRRNSGPPWYYTPADFPEPIREECTCGCGRMVLPAEPEPEPPQVPRTVPEWDAWLERHAGLSLDSEDDRETLAFALAALLGGES